MRQILAEAAALREWAAQSGAPADEALAEAERLEREGLDLHARLAGILPGLGDAEPLPAPDEIPENVGDEPFVNLLMDSGIY